MKDHDQLIQRDRILGVLSDARWTPIETIWNLKPRVLSYTKRMSELKDHGHVLQNRRRVRATGDSFKDWRLADADELIVRGIADALLSATSSMAHVPAETLLPGASGRVRYYADADGTVIVWIESGAVSTSSIVIAPHEVRETRALGSSAVRAFAWSRFFEYVEDKLAVTKVGEGA